MPGEELFYLSVTELAKRIEAKKLSPVELTQIYLDRSQKLGARCEGVLRQSFSCNSDPGNRARTGQNRRKGN